MNSEILLASIDQSKLATIQDAKWRIDAEAKPGSDLSRLSPSSEKILRSSALPSEFSTIIGGLCSIFTGDLNGDFDTNITKIIRLDQIAEAIGPVAGKSAFIVIEDSFFSDLTRTNQQLFTGQGNRALKGVENWLKLAGQANDLYAAFTSNPQLDRGLKDLVNQVANDNLKNPNFAKIQAAPVLLMYTGYWPKLLASLGLIPDNRVVCVEPIVHFVDDRILPSRDLNNAYLDFLSWLQDNPYAQPKSANANIGIAGFWESRARITQTRTRLLPFNKVPNTENYLDWCQEIANTEQDFPFPLKNSLIFMEGVNWGLYNQEIRETLANLVKLEQEYYQSKQSTPKSQRSPEWAGKLKLIMGSKTKPLTAAVSKITQSIIINVLGSI